MNKHHFIEELRQHLQNQIQNARHAAADAKEAAATMADEMEKREDSRAMLEFGSMSHGQSQRQLRFIQELELLNAFAKQELPRFDRRTPIGVGAMIDIGMETEDGQEERTFLLLPVGAGTTLTGPGGDGFISVITPSSPVGRQLMGKRVGDDIDVTVKNDTYLWHIADVG